MSPRFSKVFLGSNRETKISTDGTDRRLAICQGTPGFRRYGDP
jgi:hypothetical protein